MELQSKFQEIIYAELKRPDYDYKRMARECTKLCLKEQIKLLRNIWNEDNEDTHSGSFEIDIDNKVNDIQQQLEMM